MRPDGKPADYFSNARREIGPLLPPHSRSVLEVGCGTGETLRWLRVIGGCDVTAGLEMSEQAAAVARQHVDRVVVGNAEQLIESEFDPNSFDALLCLDVLEHMVDPWSFVESAQRLLRPGGVFIASIPNVRNIRVVAPLLARGRWEYRASGILDRTHLRFFTKNSALALMSSGSLEVFQLLRHMAPLSRKANLLTLGLFQDLLTSQYIIASKRTRAPAMAPKLEGQAGR
jgi:2-polyprenyl-3-methyl-5-hydroxy-6-metoxy-1,4-benzoquinol methylase